MVYAPRTVCVVLVCRVDDSDVRYSETFGGACYLLPLFHFYYLHFSLSGMHV